MAGTRLWRCRRAGVVLLAIMIVLGGGPCMKEVEAQGTSDCSVSLTTLQACLPYLQDGGLDPATSAPPAACCTPLNSVLSSSPNCVCQLSTALNLTRAYQLALSCHATLASSLASCLQGLSAPTPAPTSLVLPPTSPPTSLVLPPTSTPTAATITPSQTPSSIPPIATTITSSQSPSSSKSPTPSKSPSDQSGNESFLSHLNYVVATTLAIICALVLSF